MLTDALLLELAQEGREALAAPYHERVSRVLDVMPRLIDAVDEAAQYQMRLREIRLDLTLAVRNLREVVWEAQKKDPSVTLSNGHIQRAVNTLTSVLDRLQGIIGE